MSIINGCWQFKLFRSLNKNGNDSLYSLYSLCSFCYEISGNFDFGIIGRGSLMEIGTYIDRFINDELLGILLIYVL